MLSLQHLEALVAIAELGSFRAASERLNVTQPSVSLRIKELEQSLGIHLFDRSGYRPRLTTEGLEILKLAQRTLALTREIQTVARNRIAVEGKIRLGAADTFALVCLPPLLTRLEVRAPALQIALDIDYSVNLDKKLHEGELDIAFLTSPLAGPDVLLERLVPIELVWVASPRFGLESGPLSAADLASVPIITNPEPSNLFTTTMSWFSDAGVRPARLNTCSSLLHIQRLAASGVGAALLPLAILSEEIGNGTLTLFEATPAIEPHWLYMAVRARTDMPSCAVVQDIAREIVATSSLAPLRP
jgi:DNA-binding transcriptional LysR family regulator